MIQRKIEIVHLDDHSQYATSVKNGMDPAEKEFVFHAFQYVEKALQYIHDCLEKKFPIDLIITDFNHPGLNGYEFAGEVRKLESQYSVRIPVLLLTMCMPKYTPIIITGLDEKKFDKYLTKALGSKEIREVIEELLAEKVQ